jgi:outer membrane immunogenic protein
MDTFVVRTWARGEQMRKTLITIAVVTAFGGSSAYAADLPKPPLVGPGASVYSWTGFYAGGNVGGIWSSQSSSAIGGGQIGYNWQPSWLLLGAEADIQGMGLRHSALLTGTRGGMITSNDSVDYLGTVRGRVGVARGRWLAYATGGLAYTTVNHNGAGVPSTTGIPAFTGPGITGNYSGSNEKTGYAVGTGVEWAFLDRLSAKAEYLYVSMRGETDTYTTLSRPIKITYSDSGHNILRLGVNYRFLP